MTEAISLGWNCHSAGSGVEMGIRTTKLNGYKTCPFDEMITNYKGIINCILDDFTYLCDPNYIELIQIPKQSKWLNTNGNGDIMIFNKKYNFIFNHEAPGHANLFITQNWEKGINHYVLNNYEELINRYNRRIQNIKDLLSSGKNIIFILTRPITQENDIYELANAIKLKYSNLIFCFKLLDYDKYIVYDHLLLMKIDKNDEEIKRLGIIKIIVARYNENIEWTKQFKNVLIYNKGPQLSDGYNTITLNNVGREGHTYYTYIYENYDNLDEYTIFLQGNPFDHSPNIINNINSLTNNNNLNIDYGFLSKDVLINTLYNGHGPMKEVFLHLFGDYNGNEVFTFAAGAHFIVSKKNILSRPKDFYLKIIKLLEYDNHPEEGFVIERFHQFIFTGNKNQS